MPSVPGTEKPKPEQIFHAHYCEMQFIQEDDQDPGHEVLWFQCDGGQWVGMIIPEGKTFSHDGDFPDA